MKQTIEQCIRDWFVAEAETLKLVSPMVTRYRQGGPLEDAHQRLADALAGKMETTAPSLEYNHPTMGKVNIISDGSQPPGMVIATPVKRGPGRPRKNP